MNYRRRWPGLVFPNSVVLVPVLQSTSMASSGVPYGNCQREKGLGPGSQKGWYNMLVPARGKLPLKIDPEGKRLREILPLGRVKGNTLVIHFILKEKWPEERMYTDS